MQHIKPEGISDQPPLQPDETAPPPAAVSSAVTFLSEDIPLPDFYDKDLKKNYPLQVEENNSFFPVLAEEKYEFFPLHAEEKNVFHPSHAEEKNVFHPLPAEQKNVFHPLPADEQNVFHPLQVDKKNVFHPLQTDEKNLFHSLQADEENSFHPFEAGEKNLNHPLQAKEKNEFYPLQDEEKTGFPSHPDEWFEALPPVYNNEPVQTPLILPLSTTPYELSTPQTTMSRSYQPPETTAATTTTIQSYRSTETTIHPPPPTTMQTYQNQETTPQPQPPTIQSYQPSDNATLRPSTISYQPSETTTPSEPTTLQSYQSPETTSLPSQLPEQTPETTTEPHSPSTTSTQSYTITETKTTEKYETVTEAPTIEGATQKKNILYTLTPTRKTRPTYSSTTFSSPLPYEIISLQSTRNMYSPAVTTNYPIMRISSTTRSAKRYTTSGSSGFGQKLSQDKKRVQHVTTASTVKRSTKATDNNLNRNRMKHRNNNRLPSSEKPTIKYTQVTKITEEIETLQPVKSKKPTRKGNATGYISRLRQRPRETHPTKHIPVTEKGETNTNKMPTNQYTSHNEENSMNNQYGIPSEMTVHEKTESPKMTEAPYPGTSIVVTLTPGYEPPTPAISSQQSNPEEPQTTSNYNRPQTFETKPTNVLKPHKTAKKKLAPNAVSIVLTPKPGSDLNELPITRPYPTSFVSATIDYGNL